MYGWQNVYVILHADVFFIKNSLRVKQGVAEHGRPGVNDHNTDHYRTGDQTIHLFGCLLLNPRPYF